ncbi:MAG: S8 family serine peptidase [Micrococcales bacterium]|nr:S8 family serine peptidase [Micrococcales bacterium]
MTDPYRPTPAGSRPPVVAVLDTPVGPHDWFHPGRGTTVLGLPGRPMVAPGEGLTVELDGLLANEAGHGTFVAGIIRQVCPEAEILVLPVVPFAGAAAEKDVHDALALLLARQRWAIAEKKHEALVDVVNLSLGYYHESPLDAVVQDVPLKALLDRLAAAGVAVVAAAGNDGTTAKFYPAGFAVERESVLPETASQVPLVSVGAYNPGDATIALFSNSGSWVTTHRVGAAVVSTVPTTMRGSIQAGVRARRDDPTDRALIDPDDFTTGFASWSGTSFAAPVVAGQIACAVRDAASLCDTEMGACVTRGLEAVRTALTQVGP